MPKLTLNSFITILAASHYIKFFYFHISDAYIRGYQELLEDTDYYLYVYSTVWFDMKNRQHREDVVAHIFALMAWAWANE